MASHTLAKFEPSAQSSTLKKNSTQRGSEMGLAIVGPEPKSEPVETQPDIGDQFLDEFLPELSMEAAQAVLEMKRSGVLQRMIAKYQAQLQPRLPGRSSMMYVGLQRKQWAKALGIIEAVAVEDGNYSRVRELVRLSDMTRKQLDEQGF